MSDDVSPLADFTGVARLFPLPNLVLFPHVMQPLHIFEPRYRQMTADALTSDRLIAVVLLRPGWEAEYPGRPPINPVACLGKIVAEQRLHNERDRPENGEFPASALVREQPTAAHMLQRCADHDRQQ